MIKRISITDLFGRFNYDISLTNDNITILTGPNGFGKSTILRIINALSRGEIYYFAKLDFLTLVVNYDCGTKTIITKQNEKTTIDGIEYPELGPDREEFYRTFAKKPWIQRMHGGYIDRRNDEFISDEEFANRYFLEIEQYYEKSRDTEEAKRIADLKETIQQIKKRCGKVRYISDQRLIRTEYNRFEEQTVDVIRELPRQLKKSISSVSEEYSNVANKLDSTYPKRLFEAKDGICDESEYRKRLDEVNEKFEKLRKYNLVEMSIIDEEKYNPQYSTALKIYFDDFASKYSVFQNLITKLDLFTRIINSRLMFKEIKISRNDGFIVVDKDHPKKRIKLSQLSSGEKQEIVLFYELIFNTSEKLLLLIDEPEISLHISWQHSFLNDLLEVSKQGQLQAIVATHSPQIVSNHWDIQIDLGELYGQQFDEEIEN